MANMYRDVNLSEVNESYIGKELKVAGWVENIRDHGGVSFIDLRDMYGVLQVVLRDTTLLDGIHKEECIAIEGIMEQRDEETYNPKIPSGTIELEAKKITILGQVYQQLPFEVQTSKEVREDVRLKYRYLDLRNQKVKDNMIFRSKVIAFLRQKMTDMGFLEIQTPILCASSPEGARDYIVPSRKYKGKFYALPQAPQQYKQLLMVSGFDKYFQIAPCFRDEDARADRSPGEFYQLDFEMSFATQEDVFRIGEEVLTETFAKFAPEGYEVTQAPYPIISYKQAMLEFGSDKPDLRNPLRIIDLSEFFNKCTFKPFQNKTVRAINVHASFQRDSMRSYLSSLQESEWADLDTLRFLKTEATRDQLINLFQKNSREKSETLQDLSQEIQSSSSLIRKTELRTSQDRLETNLVRDLISLRKMHTDSVMLMTSQCLKEIQKLRRLDLHIIHSQCHRVDLRHLIQKIHLIFLHTSMISYATV